MGAKGGHDGPSFVAFSLGNALFDQFVPPDTRRSALLEIELDERGEVRSVRSIPLLVDVLAGQTVLADENSAQIIQDRLGANAE